MQHTSKWNKNDNQQYKLENILFILKLNKNKWKFAGSDSMEWLFIRFFSEPSTT